MLALPLRGSTPELYHGKYIAGMFGSGEQGVWYDPSDLTTLFQDAAGTKPITAVEQPVGLILDKSGRGNHAYQSTSASRPVLSARVNLLKKTEQFDDAAWAKSAATISANTSLAPNGTSTADKLVEDTSASSHHRVLSETFTPTLAPHTFSFYAKAAERGYVYIRANNGGGDFIAANVDLSEATVSQLLIGSVTVTSVGNGWVRVVGVGTPANTTRVTVEIRTSNFATYANYTGDGTSGIYIWGADLRVANDGANLPPYQRVNTATDYDTAGFPHYLKFDGIDDSLSTNSIDFTATDKMTVCAGVRKLSDAAQGILVELSSSTAANNGSFDIRAPIGAADYGFRSKGTALVSAPSLAAYAAPTTNVLTGIGNISGDQAILRVNGTQAASNTADQGAGNFGNYPLYIGRRNGASLPFKGHIYSLIVRGAQTDDAHLTHAEKYLAYKSGVTL